MSSLHQFQLSTNQPKWARNIPYKNYPPSSHPARQSYQGNSLAVSGTHPTKLCNCVGNERNVPQYKCPLILANGQCPVGCHCANN